MAEPSTDDMRCVRSGGRGWRCKNPRRDGDRYCDFHCQYGRRQRKPSPDCGGDDDEETQDKESVVMTGVVEHRRTSPCTLPEVQPAQRLYSEPSLPPPNSTHLSESQPGPRAVICTIPHIPFKLNNTPMTQADSIPRDDEFGGVDVDGLISTGTILMSKAMTLFEIGAKRLRETQKCASSAEVLKETQKCASSAEVLKEENEQLKTEVEGLKKQCSELKTKSESYASAVRQLKAQLITRVEVEGETRIDASSQAAANADWHAEKDELSRLLEQSRDEVAAKSSVIRELQSSIEALRDSADADVKIARLFGYDDGLIEGRRIGWKESVELQQQAPSKLPRLIQSCAAAQAGSSSTL